MTAEGFDPNHVAVEKAVRAGIGDVTANGAADDSGDHGKVDRIRKERLLQRDGDRRRRDKGHIKRQHDHEKAGEDDEPVDHHSGALVEENADGEERADRAAHLRINSEKRVQAETSAADIADIEEEAADDDENGKQVARAGNGGVR